MDHVKSHCVLSESLGYQRGYFLLCDVSLLLPITGYGMTEMLATHMQPRENTKPGSVGVLMANLECKVKISYVSI